VTPLVYVVLLLSLPLIATLVYAPFAPEPLYIIHKEKNMGVWYTISEFTPVWAVSAVATGLWSILCFSFYPIAKLIFTPEQMLDKPKPVYTCGTCRLDLFCVQRVPSCKRYVSILNQESYEEESG
jgi:hypothetical protein